MPAYNAERYIERTIQSILKQTLTDFELIIIDDCSTDSTWSIIQRYAKKDPRIRAYKNDENAGIAGNRNKGVKLVKSPYVAWQDADDISLPTRLEKEYNFLESHPKVGIVGAYLHFFDESGYSSIRKYAENDAELRRRIFRYSPVAQPSAMIRKSVLDDVGEYNLNMPPAEDLDMSFRIGQKYQFANIPEVLVHYRENVQSATFTKLKVIELRTIEIRRRYARSKAYHFTFMDYLYNLAQAIMISTLPAKAKIRLFNLLRNESDKSKELLEDV